MARLKYISERWERGKREKKISQPLLFRVGAVRACSIAETTFVIRPLKGICHQHIALSFVDLNIPSATSALKLSLNSNFRKRNFAL